jgi:hypothetical protein
MGSEERHRREDAYIERLLARHEANYRAYMNRLTALYRECAIARIQEAATRAALHQEDGRDE